MNKIRMVFFIAVTIIGVTGVLMFRTLEAPENSNPDHISEFKITELSGNGKIYLNDDHIDDGNFSTLPPVDIKQMQYRGNIYLRADTLTAFEFYCSGFSFIASPGSYLFYQPKTRELYLYKGEFFWQRRDNAKKSNVSASVRVPQNILQLPDAGRAKITDTSVDVWNYSNGSGGVKFNFKGEDYNLKGRQLFSYRDQKRGRQAPPAITDILPMPQGIDPLDKAIVLKKPEDTIVIFNWSVLKGEARYVFRLYSSRLRENILAEQYIDINRASVELLQFEEREFYWEVFPIDSEDKLLEGVPSKMGFVRVLGMLDKPKDIRKPPKLVIDQCDVFGNKLLVRGSAEPTATLLINDVKVNIDSDGKFYYTFNYQSLGTKEVKFTLISPFKVKTEEVRRVDVNEL